jgi:hypothetical protein
MNVNEFIKKAARYDITLTPDDFVWEEGMGGETIDGMVPQEWLDAMTEGEDPHSDYPHEAGRLYACARCESQCFCDDDPGHTECINCESSKYFSDGSEVLACGE